MRRRLKTLISNRTREYITRAAAVLGLTTVVGLLSNILILVIGYIIALPHLFDYLTGYFMNLNNTALWWLYSSLSLIFCIVMNAVFLTQIGAVGACYRNNSGGDRVLNPSELFLSVGPGSALHGILTLIVARLGLPYLFFAGPVQYIARLIGDGNRSLFADVSYSFPAWVVVLSVGIYMAAVFVGCCLGYVSGWRKEMKKIVQSEEESRRGTPPEKTWSESDAKQKPSAYRE